MALVCDEHQQGLYGHMLCMGRALQDLWLVGERQRAGLKNQACLRAQRVQLLKNGLFANAVSASASELSSKRMACCRVTVWHSEPEGQTSDLPKVSCRLSRRAAKAPKGLNNHGLSASVSEWTGCSRRGRRHNPKGGQQQPEGGNCALVITLACVNRIDYHL